MDNTKTNGNKEKKRELFRYVGIASTVGINLVISTFAGFAIGYYLLDRYFNTYPWMTILFTILGIVAGFRYLFKIVSKMASDKEDKESME